MKKRINKVIVVLCSLLALMMLLAGCGDNDNSDSVDISNIIQAYTNGEIGIDYDNAASFEKALNDGEKVNGKIVKFDVVEYKPDSALGIDCWSGEHLNFISNHGVDVSKGDVIVGYVIKEASQTLGSWKIPYEVIEINPDIVERSLPNQDDDYIEEATLLEEGSETENEFIESVDIEEAEEPTEVVIDKTKLEYTVSEISKTMYVEDSANVRSEPDADALKLGKLSQNEEVHITGQVDNGWYRISYNGTAGYVRGDLLLEQAIVKETQTVESAQIAENTQAVEKTQVVEETPLVNEPPVSSGVTYIGNKSNMKLHRANCSGKLPKESNRQYFDTLDEAIAAGYTEGEQCKNCHPFR